MKTNPGRVLEDCRRGETIVHAGPLALSGGGRAFSHALAFPGLAGGRPFARTERGGQGSAGFG